MNIRQQILEDIVYRIDVAGYDRIPVVETQKKRCIETIVAETAAAYIRPLPKPEIIADPSTPSIDEVMNEDGILCAILSRLSLREAVATCVLSPRWRNIWTYLPKLSFGAKNMLNHHMNYLLYDDNSPLKQEEIIELMLCKTDQFISSVNSLIHQLPHHSIIDEFEVRYFLHKAHSHHLDAWVNFAVESKTTKLGLYLHKPFLFDCDEDKYDFPCHLSGSFSSVEKLILLSCSLKPPSTFNGLRNLKHLELYRIDVTEEDITCLLSACYILEFLKLHRLPQLVSIRIPHSQIHFQTFIAKQCKQLRGEISINAVNLRNLGYFGFPVDFKFRQSSQLVEAFITFQTEQPEHTMDYYLNKISSNLPQLHNLTCTFIGESKVLNLSTRSKVFTHLRCLKWCWKVNVQKMSLCHLATLLDAAPFLEELYLKLWSYCPEKAPKSLEKLRKRIPAHPHAHLKKLEFEYYYWNKWFAEFTLYLVKNATALESMMIVNAIDELDEAAIEILRQEVPASVKLEIWDYL